MAKGHRTLVALGIALVALGAVSVTPLSVVSVRADAPAGPYTVTANGPSVSYNNTTGVFGWPDPNGPPAPVCNSTMCDQQKVTVLAGAAPLTDTFSLKVAATFTSTDTTLGNCLDLAIEDSTATTVYAHVSCVASGGSVTFANAIPSTQYTVEIDANANSGAINPATPQPFTATLSSAATPAPGAGPQSSIKFSTPNVMDPMESVGEPTIVHSTAKDNTVYASGPWGTGTQRSIWNASADLGETFRLVQQCAPASGFVATECQPPSSVTGTANPPGGGDTDQRIDSSGRDYFVDLWALACNRAAETPDRGATANQNAYGCQAASPTCTPTTVPPCRPEGSDRPWLAVYDPKLNGVVSTAADAGLAPIVYQEYNHCIEVALGNGCAYWAKSMGASIGTTYTAANGNGGSYGADGYPSVDQVTGDVFEPAGGKLNIGVPDANGNLCFLDDPVSTSCPGGGNALGKSLISYAGTVGAADTLFAVSSMDTGRNLHITWTTGARQVYTTVASWKTSWKTFATPVALSKPPANTNVFPWVVAGEPGRSDSVWYGTTDTGDPSTNSGQAWFVYMNQAVWPVDSSGAVTLAAPTVSGPVQVSPHPAHYDSICLVGLNCITAQGDRNLADFFTVTIDHTGAAEVEYDDTSNALIQNGFTPTSGLADHAGAPVVTIARQDAGPGLFGNNVTLRPNEPSAVPTDGQTDPGGDALYPVIKNATNGAANQPALDFVNNAAVKNRANQLSLSGDGSTLTVKMSLADLGGTAIANAATNVTGGQFLQYVTRWIQCGPYPGVGSAGNCPIYYAMAEVHVVGGQAGLFNFYAGKASSLELCSVSACDPHVEIYPDAPALNGSGTQTGGFTVAGGSVSNGVITIPVPTGDIASPTQSTLLEEVGSYSFGSAYLQSQITNNMAEADELPLEIDGVCCFNFQGQPGKPIPETPWTPALIAIGVLLLGVGAAARRRATHHDTKAA